jgi:hypothetical protein
MKHRLTRRSLVKILLAAPPALAAGPLACQSASGGRPAPQRLTPVQQKERENLSREMSRFKESIERLDRMDIAIGGEPAIHFAPLLPKK